MSSKYLSDHKPFILDDILVWNMLTKAVTTEKRTNNGFGWHESDHAYQLRLKNIIHAIGGWVAVHHLNFLALQECPKTPFQQTFIDQMLGVLAEKTGEQWSVDIFNKDLPLMMFSAKPIARVGACSDMRLVRYQLKDKQLVHVHLHYKRMHDPAKKEMTLKRIRSELKAPYLVVGDFNADITCFEWPDYAMNLGGHHFGQGWRKVDGYIASYDPKNLLLSV